MEQTKETCSLLSRKRKEQPYVSIVPEKSQTVVPVASKYKIQDALNRSNQKQNQKSFR